MNDPVCDAAISVLENGASMLAAVSPDDFARPSGDVMNGSIGAHYRHSLDHFECLLDGIPTGAINYDARKRDTAVETDRSAALGKTHALLQRLRSLAARDFEAEVSVTCAVDYGRGQSPDSRSTVRRELMFCVSHAIHHNALIAVICGLGNVTLPAEFGFAPSTLRHDPSRAGQAA